MDQNLTKQHHYSFSRDLPRTRMVPNAKSAYTRATAPTFAETLPGRLSSTISRNASFSVALYIPRASPCREYLQGLIHCSHLTNSFISVKGTKPPKPVSESKQTELSH